MSEVITAVAGLGAAYCIGGLHGLALAWSQPARIARWARQAEDLSERVCRALDDADAQRRGKVAPVEPEASL